MSDTCLQCGDSREEAREPGRICAIVSGYEYSEIEAEWPRHRWADWTDKELARQRIKPEAFERHRRSSVFGLQYAACDDLVSGHLFQAEKNEWADAGQCMLCGKRRVTS